jgi:hypothetical protein
LLSVDVPIADDRQIIVSFVLSVDVQLGDSAMIRRINIAGIEVTFTTNLPSIGVVDLPSIGAVDLPLIGYMIVATKHPIVGCFLLIRCRVTQWTHRHIIVSLVIVHGRGFVLLPTTMKSHLPAAWYSMDASVRWLLSIDAALCYC